MNTVFAYDELDESSDFMTSDQLLQPKVKKPRAKKVKLKDEGEPLIRGATCTESTVQELEKWMRKGNYSTYSFNIVVKDEKGTVTFHSRTNQPCWGELRTHYNDIHKPSDLRYPFPAGTPVAIAIWSGSHDQDVLSWALGADSPWNSINGRCGVHYVMDGNRIMGFILKDMDIDPTVLAQMLLCLKGFAGQKIWKKMVDKGANPTAAYIFCWNNTSVLWGDKELFAWDHSGNPYAMHKVNLKRWMNARPRQITMDANTFTERGAYNRPEIHNLWDDGDAVKLSDIYQKKYPNLNFDKSMEIIADIVKQYKE